MLKIGSAPSGFAVSYSLAIRSCWGTTTGVPLLECARWPGCCPSYPGPACVLQR